MFWKKKSDRPEVLPTIPVEGADEAGVTERPMGRRVALARMGAVMLATPYAVAGVCNAFHESPKPKGNRALAFDTIGTEAEWQAPTVERQGNMTTIRYPNGGVHYLLFNGHALYLTKEQESAGSNSAVRQPDRIPDGVQVIIPETVRYPWSRHPMSTMGHLSQDPQYQDIFNQVHERQMMVVLSQPYIASEQTSANQQYTEIGAAGLGAGLALLQASKIAKDPEQRTRRKFLSTTVPTAMGGAWLMTPAAATVGRLLSLLSGRGHDASASFNQTAHDSNPLMAAAYPAERINAVLMTEKAERLLHDTGIRAIATVIGVNHSDMESVAMMPREERYAFLRQHLATLREAVEPDTLAQMQVMLPSGTGSQTWNVGRKIAVPRLVCGHSELRGDNQLLGLLMRGRSDGKLMDTDGNVVDLASMRIPPDASGHTRLASVGGTQ